MKRLIMQTGFTALMALFFLSAIAVAEDWTNVVVNHEEQFTDGGGMNRRAKVLNVKFKPHTVQTESKMGNFEIQDFMATVEIDGAQRTIIYSIPNGNQINITVLGTTEQEQVSIVFHNISVLVNNENVTEWMKSAGWIMSYKGVRLYGNVGKGAQGTTVGTDPISFAALSYNIFANKSVAQVIMGADNSSATKSAIKILGGLFGGPKIGAGMRCYKKKVKTITCSAHCAQTADGCGCECLNIPCCSECSQTEETVWEYSAGAQAG
ncbi:MAG: hypothetical protein AB7H80_12615 [Candidatus Kapaibacterium sp.]